MLDVRDAVGNKMCALYSRGEVRGYIDIHLVLHGAVFSHEQVLSFADDRDALPQDRELLALRFEAVAGFEEQEFERYHADKTEVCETFTAWIDRL